jgi:hypothetical protein
MKSKNIEDFLDEDAPVRNQKYFVLSYLLPKDNNELETCMIKVRGSFNTIEECSARIEKLKSTEKYFNMYISEVGKWGGLFKEERIKEMDNVDIIHREELMNKMMSEYKKNKDQGDLEFEKRKEFMVKKAKEEGISGIQESREELLARLDFIKTQMEEIKERVSILENIENETKEKLDKIN